MMRLTIPFPDFNNLFSSAPHDIMWLVFGKGIDYLFKNRKTIFKLKNFRKNYNWFKIAYHIISFIMTANLQNLFEKLKLKPLVQMCNRIMRCDFKTGLAIFQKIEPELSLKIAQFVVQINNDYKIYKTTGIKTAFLQKYFPDLTP